MALRRYRSWAGLAVGAVALGTILVSSHSLAGDDKEASKKGGTLVCYGQRGNSPGRGPASTELDLMNNNDQSTIQIDRIVFYRFDGSVACDLRPARLLGPHATYHQFTEGPGAPTLCPNWQPATLPGNYAVTIVVYWSFTECRWPWNELSGVTQVVNTAPDGQLTQFGYDCKPIDARL